jgi:large subunit ribosomal protein L6
MSRIGKKPIVLPSGVEVTISNGEVVVKGPKGQIARPVHPDMNVSVEEDGAKKLLNIENTGSADNSPVWGTTRAHVNNMILGVTKGWEKALELNGVGFKMAVQGKKLNMSLGFSHPVVYDIPAGVEAVIEGNALKLSGIDKETVGQTAAEIRSLKKPEPYKGKGFKYTDEVIRRKAGKAAKSD